MIRNRLRANNGLDRGNNLECDISIGRGEKGDAFTFEDFTSEQLESLRGEKGDMGEAFKYEDFTPEQLEALRGEKGDKGENVEFNKSSTHIQYKHEGETEWKDLVPLEDLKVEETVINSLLDQIQTLTDRVLALEENIPKPPEPMDAPTFIGLITPFKNIADITYEDLNVDTVLQNIVEKPQAIYKHSAGTKFNRSCVIAIPKEFGSIVGVVDGADITIGGAYHWIETVLNIPDVGNVEYIIGGNIKAQAYNNSTVVKWNLA